MSLKGFGFCVTCALWTKHRTSDFMWKEKLHTEIVKKLTWVYGMLGRVAFIISEQ